MELRVSVEREASLRQVALRQGKDANAVLEEAIDRLVEYDTAFLEAVEEGRAAARRGESIDHSEVVDRIGKMFR